MGDYYKYKKILVILMIVSCGFSIIKNIFKTKVQASEAVEVTPVWNDGNYTYQADNQFLTLRQNQIDIQDAFINALLVFADTSNNTYYNNARQVVVMIKNAVTSESPGNTGWTGSDTRFIWFGRVTGQINGSNNYNYYFQTITADRTTSNITYADATLDNGYKLLSVPFYNVTRSVGNQMRYFNGVDGSYFGVSTGSQLVPVPEVGCYSYRWVDVFQKFGLLSGSNEYEDILTELNTTLEESYTQQYYTKQAVQNTYSYMTNDNVDSISSTGITQPQVTEPDISDAFDSLSDLLTNDNATTKFFTFTLPNGSNHVFALSPDFLRNCLTRVGGGELVTIIETLWYIGLYGLMIFTGLKIIGALLSGDLDAVTGVLSPVNSVVNSSLEVTGAFRTSGGDESAFRIRKG